jgi:hypothetical protein
VADKLGQAGVGAQMLEVVRAFAAHGVQHHKALHQAGFVEAALATPHPQVPVDAFGNTQGAESSHQPRHAALGSQLLLERLRVDLKLEFGIGGVTLGRISHFPKLMNNFTNG